MLLGGLNTLVVAQKRISGTREDGFHTCLRLCLSTSWKHMFIQELIRLAVMDSGAMHQFVHFSMVVTSSSQEREAALNAKIGCMALSAEGASLTSLNTTLDPTLGKIFVVQRGNKQLYQGGPQTTTSQWPPADYSLCQLQIQPARQTRGRPFLTDPQAIRRHNGDYNEDIWSSDLTRPWQQHLANGELLDQLHASNQPRQ